MDILQNIIKKDIELQRESEEAVKNYKLKDIEIQVKTGELLVSVMPGVNRLLKEGPILKEFQAECIYDFSKINKIMPL